MLVFFRVEQSMDEVDDDILVDSDNENVEDNMNQVEAEIVQGDCSIVPEVRMTFKDENEMWDFYKRYAYAVGFPGNSKKDEDGVLNAIGKAKEVLRTAALSSHTRQFRRVVELGYLHLRLFMAPGESTQSI